MRVGDGSDAGVEPRRTIDKDRREEVYPEIMMDFEERYFPDVDPNFDRDSEQEDLHERVTASIVAIEASDDSPKQARNTSRVYSG